MSFFCEEAIRDLGSCYVQVMVGGYLFIFFNRTHGSINKLRDGRKNAQRGEGARAYSKQRRRTETTAATRAMAVRRLRSLGKETEASRLCGGVWGSRGRGRWSSETSEAMETCSGELLLRRAAVELEGDGFAGSWAMRGCQGGAR